MSDVERQCSLIKRTTRDADAGGFATKRLPSIGADNKMRNQRLSLPRRDGDRGIVGRHVVRLAIDLREAPSFRGPRLHGGHQRAVFDVVAERIESDLVGREPHLRRANKASGIVDKPHNAESRGIGLAAGPYVKLP